MTVHSVKSQSTEFRAESRALEGRRARDSSNFWNSPDGCSGMFVGNALGVAALGIAVALAPAAFSARGTPRRWRVAARRVTRRGA